MVLHQKPRSKIKRMKKYFILASIFFSGPALFGQTLFFNSVKIDFEKVTNLHNQLKEMNPEWYQMVKDRTPATSTEYYNFIADEGKSIYKPGREVTTNGRNMFMTNVIKPVVYTDFTTGISISQKPVFEETFLVTDSLTKIRWKLTPDTREIAGFNCRKAVGILNDTIGIFAFYTDELMISGGPEDITGLPGMILGLAIPRLHTTWFATKVEVKDVPVKEIVPEKKGKKMNRKEMIEAIDKAVKNWGPFASMVKIMLVI